MNLLEHYIDKIISEEKVISPSGDKYYRVQAEIDCYGQKETINRLFTIEEWEKAREKGFYMA